MFTSKNGLIIGKVTNQKLSQAVAPSIFAASYDEDGIDCNADKNSIICIPERHTISNILLSMFSNIPTILSGRPISFKKSSSPLP